MANYQICMLARDVDGIVSVDYLDFPNRMDVDDEFLAIN